MFNSEYVLILKTLATVEMHLNNNDNALSLIEKAIEANPNESELHNLRGLILKAGESINTL
jgi:Flp pilus assembly protein TadD